MKKEISTIEWIIGYIDGFIVGFFMEYICCCNMSFAEGFDEGFEKETTL